MTDLTQGDLKLVHRRWVKFFKDPQTEMCYYTIKVMYVYCIITNNTYKDIWYLAKSLCRSHAGSHFNGTEYEIWAGFGPVGNTEKTRSKVLRSYSSQWLKDYG